MKSYSKIAMLLLLTFSLAMPVLAHSGRTDANGGHTDHSTGEYHYHHGEAAHQHWDMDRDGVVECPYTFNQEVKYNTYAAIILGYVILFIIGFAIRITANDGQPVSCAKTAVFPIIYFYIWSVVIALLFLIYSEPGRMFENSIIADGDIEKLLLLFLHLFGKFHLYWGIALLTGLLFCKLCKFSKPLRTAIYINLTICIWFIFAYEYFAIAMGAVWHSLTC